MAFQLCKIFFWVGSQYVKSMIAENDESYTATGMAVAAYIFMFLTLPHIETAPLPAVAYSRDPRHKRTHLAE